MSPPGLKALIVEDEPDDAELMVKTLGEAGFAVTSRRVQARDDYERALDEFTPDVILIDLALPHFDGLGAIRIARGRGLHVPVIVVTGTAPDAAAAEVLRQGATDYVLKDRLARLGPAVRTALAAEHSVGESRRLEAELLRSEVRYRRLFQSAHDGILIVDAHTGAIEDVNPFLHSMLGYARDDLVGKTLWDAPLFQKPTLAQEMFTNLRRAGQLRFEDLPLQARDGSRVDAEFVCNIYEEEGGREVAQCNIRDIRQRVVLQRRMQEQLDELRRFESVAVDREQRVEELKAEVRKLRTPPLGAGGSGP